MGKSSVVMGHALGTLIMGKSSVVKVIVFMHVDRSRLPNKCTSVRSF